MESVNLIELSDQLIESWMTYYKSINTEYDCSKFYCYVYPKLPVWARRRLETRFKNGDLDEQGKAYC